MVEKKSKKASRKLVVRKTTVKDLDVKKADRVKGAGVTTVGCGGGGMCI